MKTGDLFFIHKGESQKDVFIYLIKNLHLSFGSVITNVFPSYKKEFRYHFYIDNTTDEMHFRDIKEDDLDVIPEIDSDIMRGALDIVFNKGKFL